ncbi:MAG: hypothetical protein J2P16_05090 [Mycobacterium sp.]|nr:hypothetical protein [Mycobacterium sp.]
MDQASFLGLRATGQGQTIQCVWVYRRPIDLDALRRFHRNLGRGLLGRRIERSPLPFARHRWISCPGPPDIDVAECARPRGELSAWADERGQLPVDPERGPGWHLGVLPFTDGSTAISLAASHTVLDGRGLCLAIADAVRGDTRDLGYPPPASRTRRRAVIEDARQTAQGVPEIVRTLRAAAKLARRRRHEFVRARPSRPVEAVGDAEEAVIVPAITVYVDVNDWDARAYSLGGTSNSLVAGFTAKLAEHAERRRSGDGAVNLSFPVSERDEGDVRANALAFADVSVDPTSVTTDLGSVRAAVKQTLKTLRETPDESLQLLPLTPLTPKRAVKRLAEVAFGYDELPVGCSNLGDIDPVLAYPDGSEADRVFLRLVEQHTTRASLQRTRGILNVGSGRIVGKVFLTVAAYRLDRENSKSDLRQLAARTLAEFELVGAID